MLTSVNLSAAPRRALVKRVVAQKRRQHQELRDATTLESFTAVTTREGVSVVYHDMHDAPLAFAVNCFGDPAICLNSRLSGRALLEIAFHELGHVHMNHLFDPLLLATATADGKKDPRFDARCEAEANLYAELMIGESLRVPRVARLRDVPAWALTDLARA